MKVVVATQSSKHGHYKAPMAIRLFEFEGKNDMVQLASSSSSSYLPIVVVAL
jgi:hypothetical protein